MHRRTLACLRWPPLPLVPLEIKVAREVTPWARGALLALLELCEAEGRAAHGGIPQEQEAGARAGCMEKSEVQEEERGLDHGGAHIYECAIGSSRSDAP